MKYVMYDVDFMPSNEALECIDIPASTERKKEENYALSEPLKLCLDYYVITRSMYIAGDYYKQLYKNYLDIHISLEAKDYTNLGGRSTVFYDEYEQTKIKGRFQRMNKKLKMLEAREVVEAVCLFQGYPKFLKAMTANQSMDCVDRDMLEKFQLGMKALADHTPRHYFA